MPAAKRKRTTPVRSKSYGKGKRRRTDATQFDLEDDESEITQAAEPDEDVEMTVDVSVNGSVDPLNRQQHELLAGIVCQKLLCRRPVAFHGCEDERRKVASLVRQTVEFGESNSMLLIGPRSSGKTRAVNDALKELSGLKSHPFHTVRLNGYIQTDDRQALREIWRQLGKELEPDEEEQSTNYADTLTKLLAVLSHPSELSDEKADEVADSVVFVIDEFDQFATHSRQTLLYNLFDIAQSRKAPIAVLGLTTKVNVLEMLEKRVKSRFSHRHAFFKTHTSEQTFKETCRAAVRVEADELSATEYKQLTATLESAPSTPSEEFKSKATPTKRAPLVHKLELRGILDSWNAVAEKVLEKEDVSADIAYVFYTTKAVPQAFLVLLPHIARSGAPASKTDRIPPKSYLPPDNNLHLLPQLPLLALMLLIAAARLDIVLATDICNLKMAYEEYASLVSKARLAGTSAPANGAGAGALLTATSTATRLWSMQRAREAWAQLVDMGLLVPVAGGAARRRIGDGDMVRCDVVLEEICGGYEAGGEELDRGLAKWCKEI